MASRLDVIRMAARRLAILAADASLTADEESHIGTVLDAMFAELPYTQDITFSWDLDEVPSEALLPLGYALAAEPAVYEHFVVQPMESRAKAIMRLRAYALQNDSDDTEAEYF